MFEQVNQMIENRLVQESIFSKEVIREHILFSCLNSMNMFLRAGNVFHSYWNTTTAPSQMFVSKHLRKFVKSNLNSVALPDSMQKYSQSV